MDKAEFTRRVLECEQKMYRTAYCMLRNSTDCQDAVQEAIFAAWRKRDTLRDDSVFESWLMMILVNACRELLRRRKRRGEVELLDIYPMPESRDHALESAVRGLDEKLRIPVILRYVNGYSAQEVAQMMRLPYRSVLKRLRQAKDAMKITLKEASE